MEFTRGDYKQYKFKRTRKSDKSVITEIPDEMYITFKKNSLIKQPLFQKKLSDETIKYSEDDNYYRIEILPEDTDNLAYDTTYYFDIEIIIGENKPITIHKGTLRVTEEYTHKENEV